MSDKTIMVVGSLNREAPYFQGARGVGLGVYAFDKADGSAQLLCETGGVDNPTYLTVDAAGRFIYANSEVFGWPEGTVSAYRFDPATNRLLPVNKQPSLGSITAHSSLDATGRFLLVANYGMGPMDEGPNQAVAVYPIRGDGGLAPPVATVAYGGQGPNAARQERPHAHCVLPSPDNRFAVIADLGLDALLVYKFGDEGKLSKEPVSRSALPPGSGPRHFLFHPSGNLAVVICELDSTITSLRYHSGEGRFDIIDTASAVPAGIGENHCSGIQLHPSGRFVYGANRGHNSVIIFGLDHESGRLSHLGHQTCGGVTPRDMAIDPSGRFLLVANQNSDRISVFAIDQDSGAIRPTGRDIEVGTPMCIKFAGV